MFVFLFSLLILSFCHKVPVNAMDCFLDDFSLPTLDSKKWQCSEGECRNKWELVGGKLRSTAAQRTLSTLTGQFLNVKNFELQSTIKGLKGIDQQFVFRQSDDSRTYYMIGFRYYEPKWPQDPANNIVLYKFNNGSYTLLKKADPSSYANLYTVAHDIETNIKFIVKDNTIKIYFGSWLVIDYVDVDNPLLNSGTIGLQSWGGDFNESTEMEYDNFIVSSNECPSNTTTPTPTSTPIPTLTPIVTPTSTPTFTPTPTPTPRKKVIIIPGMGASWNSEALVYNKSVKDNSWKMTPFVKNYDSLIGSLRLNGYEGDKDLFVWNYDWRRPLPELVKKFGEYFDSKILPDDKATVVGHSMGGVIGRIWLQGILNDKRVEKVVSLGSPQSGAMDPYTLWNGGKVAVKDSVSSIALNILLQLHKDKFQTNADVIKNFVPSTRDLVPVYNFLSLGKNTIPYSAISFPNNYLMQTNSEVIGLTSKYFAVVGIGDSTPSWLTLEKRNWYDRLFNIWPDGRPKLTMFANGDGTVLRESQSVGGVSTSEYISNHGDIVNDSIPIVLSMIGVGKTIPKPNFDLEGSSVYYIGSPVVVEASCQTGDFVSDESGFLVIDKDSGNCKIGLRGTDDGTYHLVAGTVGGDSWKYFEGEIKKDEKIGVKEKEFNNKFILEIIKRDLNKLGLGGLEKQVNKNNLMAVLKGVVDYRRKYDEIPITERLIDNLLSIIKFEHVIKSPVSTINGYSNFGKINKSTALSMQKAESLMSSLKTYKSDWSKSMVTLTEAWVLLGGR